MYFNSLRTFLSWKYLIRLIVVTFGLFLVATGIVCTYRSGIGLGPWDVLHQGISRHTPLSFGAAGITVGALLVLASLLLKVYPGIGTLLNMTLIGIFLDWQLRLNWLPDLSGLPLVSRLLVDVIGVLLLGLGGALYISPHMGAGPRDGLMLRLHALTKKRISIVRATLECSALLIGFLLGGTVGIGTLISAFGIGPAIEIGFGLIKKLQFIDSLQPHLAPTDATTEGGITTGHTAVNRVPIFSRNKSRFKVY
jgi:uncharacterized membrane protein YczE